jgi:hypothetical protein
MSASFFLLFTFRLPYCRVVEVGCADTKQVCMQTVGVGERLFRGTTPVQPVAVIALVARLIVLGCHSVKLLKELFFSRIELVA